MNCLFFLFNSRFDYTIANQVKLLAEKIYNEEVNGVDQVFDEFKSNQKRELLSQLYEKPALSCEKIESIEKYYNFGSTKNSEILFRLSNFFFIACIV